MQHTMKKLAGATFVAVMSLAGTAHADDVKIGFAAPMTGAQAHYGKDMQNGIVLAIEDINATKPTIGGKPVKFVLDTQDDQADPRTGTTVAQKLVDDGIKGMLGHFNSGTTIPASRIYANAGIPQIAMATAPEYTTQGYKTTFRMMTSDTQQGSVAGTFAVKDLGMKKIAIVDDRTAYGQGLADQFEKAGQAAGAPLVDSIKRGFVYSDGWVDDARLVVLNALDAQERGARILTRTKLVSAERRDGQWHARLQRADGSTLDVRARAIANAAGPWVGEVLHGALGRGAQHSVRLVKGSHIITPRLFDHDHAYIFQNPDKRIIFAIPYERDFTLIGTTDVEYRDDPSRVAIDRDETRYLCESINRYFKRKISPADVCWTYSGVRPLLEDENADNPSAVTRDYRLELDDGEGAPLLSVFGGKITTFRKLAEEATDMLGGALGAARGAPGLLAARAARLPSRRRAA